VELNFGPSERWRWLTATKAVKDLAIGGSLAWVPGGAEGLGGAWGRPVTSRRPAGFL